MAKDLGIKYDVCYVDNIKWQDYIETNPQIIKKGNYHRFFIGDWYECAMYMVATEYAASDYAYIGYLDDGISTMDVLRGIYRHKPSSWSGKLKYLKNNPDLNSHNAVVKHISDYGIIDTSCYFTICHDIINKKYQLYPNTFSHIQGSVENRIAFEGDNILVVGSFIKRDAEQFNVPLYDMEALLYTKLREVKGKYGESDTIIYIPHGSDDNAMIPKICDIIGVRYQRISEPIELFSLKLAKAPIAIYGIHSTALLNLKKLFHQSIVTNWFVNNKNMKDSYYEHFTALCGYFKKNGIIIENIEWREEGIKEKIRKVHDNVKGLVDFISKKIHKK